jgi:hypothetical protein
VSAPEIVRVADVDQITAFAQKLPVFPCARTTKRPCVKALIDGSKFGPEHGCNSATRDPETIRQWWGEWPDSLVAVPMGSPSGGLVAIDYDTYKNDPASANWWQEHAAALMSARIHQSGRGGKHYLFQTTTRVKSVNGPTLGGIQRKAIDVKADGGYIIWWPFHGRAIIQGEGGFPPLPAGLLDEVFHVERATPPAPTPAKWQADKSVILTALSYVPADCDRNEWLKTGLELHHHSEGAEDGFTLFHQWSKGDYSASGETPGSYEGEASCRKVWNHASVSRGGGVAVRGIGGLFRRAEAFGYRQPRRRDAAHSVRGPDNFDPGPVPVPGIDFDADTGETSFTADGVKAGARERRRNQDRPSLPPALIDRAPSMATVVQKATEELPWIYIDRIPAGAFLIVARPKLGKSWFVLQLCMYAAMGRDFLGFLSNGAVESLGFFSEDDTARIKSRRASLDLEAPQGMHTFTSEEIANYATRYSGQMTFPQFLESYLEQYPSIKVVIVDTESECLRMWDGENAGSQERSVTKKDYADVSTFSKIAMRRGVFIGLVNHTRKSRGGAGGHYEDPHEMINRTNTANAGASGSIVFDQPGFNPEEEGPGSKIVRMSLRGRDIKGDHAFALEMMNGGRFENRGEWSEHRATAAETEVLDNLIELHTDTPSEWHTAKDLGSWMEKKPDAVRKVLQRMMKRDSVGSRVYRGWRVMLKRGKGISITKVDGTP